MLALYPGQHSDRRAFVFRVEMVGPVSLLGDNVAGSAGAGHSHTGGELVWKGRAGASAVAGMVIGD